MTDTAPMSQDEVLDDTLRRYRQWFRLDKDHTDEWRRMAKEDFEFLAGEQWSAEDVRTLKEQMRPVVTFNRTNPIINSISGMEIGNRQEVKYIPREMGDSQANELLTKAAEWYRDQSNADDEDSDMFLDAAVCGLGATETTLDFEEDEEGAPMISAINPLECYWDHAARKKNFTDSSRRWRVREKALSDVLEMFDAEIAAGIITRDDLDASWAKYGSEREKPQDRTPGQQYNGDDAQSDKAKDDRLVTIVQLQYKKRITVYDVTDPATGQSAEVPEEKFATLSERAMMVGMPIQARPRRKSVIMNVFIGSKVLRETEALCPTGFSIQFTTFYMERTTGLPYGMMRLMKDPQRWSNKWMSQAMHILNTNAKGGWFVEEGAVDDIREFEKTVARVDKVTTVEDGALANGKLQPKHQPSMDGSFFNMMQFAIQAVPDVTGVNIEQLGLRNANQAASLEAMRKQAGAMNLAPVFDNLRRYRRDQGKVMLHLIKLMAQISPQRLVRIVGDEGAQYVPLAVQADVKYDIIVDDQVNTPDQKMQIWQMAVPFIQSMPPSVLLAMLDFSPFPPSVVEKIRKAAQAAGPSPEDQQLAQQGKQLALRKEAAGVEKDASQAALNTAKAEQINAENALGAVLQRLGLGGMPVGAGPFPALGSNLIA